MLRCTTLLTRDLEAFDVFKNMLPLTSFTGAPHSLDETGVVKCVLKTRCDAGALTQITDQMSVDLSHVDRRAHEATRDRGLVGGVTNGMFDLSVGSPAWMP